MSEHHLIACHVLWREMCHFASLSPHTYTFNFLQQGLHNTPDRLRAELQAAIDRADAGNAADAANISVATGAPVAPRRPDAILLGYGLCCNGLMGIRARRVPLVAVRAHDCITFLLGSKERYRTYFDAHPGTYWFSPGWIETTPMPGPERHARLEREFVEKYGEEDARYLLETEESWMRNYSNAAYVDLAIGGVNNESACGGAPPNGIAEAHREFTRRSAEWLGWKCDFLTGNPRLVRDFLDGRWNSDDFLVVEPGCEIAPSYDDSILKSVEIHE